MERFLDVLAIVSGEILIFLGLGIFIFIAGKSQSRLWWIWYLLGGLVGIPLILLGYWFAESILGMQRFEVVTTLTGLVIVVVLLKPPKKSERRSSPTND